MGNSESKPSAGPHEWKPSGAIGASRDLVESIQSSSETDASRARLVELHIESRLAEKLKELQEKESAALKEAHEKISTEETSPPEDSSDLSRQKVSKEVQALRARLESRKQVRELPQTVESARSEVVRCLREHDRRPLDCWKEVEAFKEEVRRLEKGWVDKTVS